ncbi:MAG: endolytic transglycosylase MltG [Gammaproteobacteria bacterium]
MPGRRLTIAAAALALAAIALYVGWRDFLAQCQAPLEIQGGRYDFVLERGTSLSQLTTRLHRDGVVRRPICIRLAARRAGVDGRLKAGEYRLISGMNGNALLEMLVQGRVIQRPFTIVEGWTFADLRRALAQLPALDATLQSAPDAQIMARLGAPGVHPEGQFLPDTYFYTRGATDLELLRRARQAMMRRLDEHWESRVPGLPYRSAYEALTLASIVEKETGVASERPRIAGVFVRRLLLGMRLQTDPTVIYGLGAGFDGNLRRADLQSDTAYNTYLRTGLPPTPIAMPGAAALAAVFAPAAGEELYFVARGDGSHEFSASLDDHNRAVVRFQSGATR